MLKHVGWGRIGTGHIVIGFVALSLAGCASGGPSGKEVLTSSIAPSQSRLVLYRTAVVGMAVQPSYNVNGKPVAPTQPNGFVVCDLAPGKYTINVENLSLNINFGGGVDKVDVVLKPGDTQYVRADINMGLTIGVVTLTHVQPGQGQTETEALSKQEATCA
jgi:hypothetical protein